MRPRYVVLAVAFCLSPLNSHAQDYTKLVKRCVHNALGSDFDKYQYLSAPIDNFGTATMYPEAAKGQTFDIKTAGLFGDPQTWWTFTDATRVATELDKLRPSGNGGGVAATCNTSTKFSLSAVLPALAKVLSINASVNYNKTVKVQISFSNIQYRTLNWSVLAEDDKNKLIDPTVSAHLGAHDFLITIGDVVLTKYTAELSYNKNLDVSAKAQLTAAWKQFAKDSSLTADFSSGADGTYTFTAKNPVIAALYVGQPPPGVVLEKGATNFVRVPLSDGVLRDLVGSKPADFPTR